VATDPSLEELERLYEADDRRTSAPATRSTSTPARSSSTTRSSTSPPRRSSSSAAQLLDNPGALTTGSGSSLQVTGIGKVALSFIVLMVALDVFARSTGQTFTLDLLHPTQLFGGSDQSAQLPSLTFPDLVKNGTWATPPPPTATSPGGGGHSNQS